MLRKLSSDSYYVVSFSNPLRHLHISHNAPYLPPPPHPTKKIFHNLCFSFLLGITAVLREIENNAYAKFWGQIRCVMGDVQVVYCLDYHQGGLGTRSCIMGLKTPDARNQKEQSRAAIEHDTAIQENLRRNFWIAGHLPRRLLYTFSKIQLRSDWVSYY